MEKHIEHVQRWKQAKTKKAKDEIVTTTGTRWSPFLEIPSIDLIDRSTVDPMHGCFEVSVIFIFMTKTRGMVVCSIMRNVY
jgi:hypothetical protein